MIYPSQVTLSGQEIYIGPIAMTYGFTGRLALIVRANNIASGSLITNTGQIGVISGTMLTGFTFAPELLASNNTSVATATVAHTAPYFDLAINKSYTGATPKINNTGVYLLTVYNSGLVTGINVKVTDYLPTGVTLLSRTGSALTKSGINMTGILDFTFSGNFVPNTGKTITLIVRFDAPGTLINVATVSNTSNPIAEIIPLT